MHKTSLLFIIDTLEKAYNQTFELRQIAVYCVSIVCALFMEICLRKAKITVHVLFEAIWKIRQTHTIVVIFVLLLDVTNYYCCVYVCQ